MKVLIVEDDFSSRVLLQEILKPYGQTHVAVNGREAVEAVRLADAEGSHYDLICLDIMMPEMDGHQTLRAIRAMEESRGVPSTLGAKIIMVTALGDPKSVFDAYEGLCDAYLTKPIEKGALLRQVRSLGLIG